MKIESKILYHFILFILFMSLLSCKNKCDYYSKRGESLFTQNKYKKAIKCFTVVIEDCSHPKKALYLRAKSNLYLENYNFSLDDINNLIKEDSNYLDARIIRGIIYTKIKKYNSALSDFSYGTEKNPYQLFARMERSKLYVQTGNMELALQDINYVLSKDSLNTDGLLQRAQIYAILHNDSLSKEDLIKLKKAMFKQKNALAQESSKMSNKPPKYVGGLFRLLSRVLREID